MSLKDTQIRNIKPQDKPFKVSDGDGLFLLVNPNGSKWWRFRYSHDGKEKGISFGTYPEVSLQAAREKRSDARVKVAAGIDPSAVRKQAKSEVAHTFEAVFRDWYGKIEHTWVPDHGSKVMRIIERDILPFIGSKPIGKIAPGDVLAALEQIENRGATDTARRARRACSQVFRYAISSGISTTDPAMTLDNVLRKHTVEHFPSITEPQDVAVLLRVIEGFRGTFVVKCALRLAPLVFVRPAELRMAEWSEIDFDSALWSIPAEKMKMRQPHIVPLSRQALEILKSIHQLTGEEKYVFPSARTPGKSMSGCAVRVALKTLGYDGEMTGHGWRATFRTIGDEVLQFPYHIIEHQLAHAVRDPNGRAYNRTSHLPERKKMMQAWADYLDGLKAGAKIIPFRKTGTHN